MLGKLIFDTTDSNTIADSAHVGSHTLDGAGGLIGSQAIAASNWLQAAAAMFDGAGTAITSTGGALDVNLKSPVIVNVDSNGIYDVSTNPTPSNTGLVSQVRSASPGLSGQTFLSSGGAASADAVVAANVQGLDTNSFGMLYNGTTWDRWHGTSGSANVSVTNASVTVSDAALANTAILATATSLTTAGTAQAAVASPLASRKYLWLYNNDNRTMYVGSSAVDATSGFPIPPGTYMELRAGAAVGVQLISTKNLHDARALELS